MHTTEDGSKEIVLQGDQCRNVQQFVDDHVVEEHEGLTVSIVDV